MYHWLVYWDLQEAQMSQTGHAILRVVEYFAKLLMSHSE